MRPVALLMILALSSAVIAEDSTSAGWPSSDASRPAQERFGWFKRVAKDWRNRLDRARQSQSLRDRLHVTATPSDVLLVSRCRSLLAADPTLSSLNIHVACSEGVITLAGDVPTESARLHVHRLASNTEGVQAVQNNLRVNLAGTIQAHYVGASLLPPVRLDSPSRTESPAFAPASPVPPKSAVILGSPVSIASRPGLPEVHAYTIHRTMPSSDIPFSLPGGFPAPSSQTVAKNPLEPSVLPSGFRTGGERSVIPAPGSKWAASSPAPAPYAPIEAHQAPADHSPVRIPAMSRPNPSEATAKDISALLQLDPRAREMTFAVRGSEIVLAGTIASPEDLYDLARRINEVPGVEFVSFADVSFAH